jgi:nitrate/nitrite transport system permease protein|tara:strand:+ start:1409 stop:2254 length:846 start_codon:yes stop_codon:yes gene_type:complete
VVSPQTLKVVTVSLGIFICFLIGWQALVVAGQGEAATGLDPEYAALMGAQVTEGASALPSPGDVGSEIWGHITNPFYDAGPNDKGVGIQLAYSIARVLSGYFLAALVAIPLGFLIGMSETAQRALNPYIQLMKPVSPLAWMPLALYTIKDSNTSAVFVIFICSIWPMLTNTTFGVASVRREWLDVSRTLEVGSLRTALRVILPAAAPTIVTGMRISIGIAWLVIVAAEMLVGGTGIGYFVWNEWNNLSITGVISAIFFIGVVGMCLDMILAKCAAIVSYSE